jgi:ribonuclease HII
MPDFSIEDTLAGCVAGIDEAGRGPWAGPVVAAAVVLDRVRLPPDLAGGLDDSKKLSAKQREALFDGIALHAAIGVGEADVVEIDSMNILAATLLAMRRAVDALPAAPDFALVDGIHAPQLDCPARCIVRGDASSCSIAAASIVAKVTRDRAMAVLAGECPGYGWDHNAGYGTVEHAAALERLGVTRHHRRSFAPVARLLSNSG